MAWFDPAFFYVDSWVNVHHLPGEHLVPECIKIVQEWFKRTAMSLMNLMLKKRQVDLAKINNN